MTYTPETQAILDATQAGHLCPDCGAPTHLRHFDECPQHPHNRRGGLRSMTCTCGHTYVDHKSEASTQVCRHLTCPCRAYEVAA